VDFDPRDYDARDPTHEDHGRDLGRGPGSNDRDDAGESGVRHREDPRRVERDREPRADDPRDVFMRHVDLPRTPDRQIVYDVRERAYTLRASETRTLATVGAFRVVSARDLEDHSGRSADPRTGDLRHLREQGLVRTERLDGHRDHLVVLTDRGRDLLNQHRVDRGHEHDQTFYAGLVKPREAEHDAQIFPAYLREAEQLAERGAEVERVMLDYELKREYQRWLHERDADRDDADGRPDRERAEIDEWAREHDLPYFDEQVHFPDLRIEYELDGRHDRVDVEVVTLHYRGAHGSAAARSGFSAYRGSSLRIGGGGGGSRGGGRLGGLAEELLE
jgi:DNA-binding MarR family transcriptional regulator